MTDITAVLTGHNEGELFPISWRSMLAAADHAEANGLTVEFVHEHRIGVERYWPWMAQVEGRPDLWRIPPDRPALPLTWSFRARR